MPCQCYVCRMQRKENGRREDLIAQGYTRFPSAEFSRTEFSNRIVSQKLVDIYEVVKGVCIESGMNYWISVRGKIIDNIVNFQKTSFICLDVKESRIRVAKDDRETTIRLGRFLRRNLKMSEVLDENRIQNVTDQVQVKFFPDVEIQIYSGSDIVDNYADEVGGNSCMTGESADYTGMYADNPQVYSQLVMFRNSNSARAMLVKLDCGVTFMDRIYTDSSLLADSMYEYAKLNKFAYREPDGDVNHNGNDISADDYVVSSLQWEQYQVPYQDTLYNGHIQDNGLMTIELKENNREFYLDSTEGWVDAPTVCEVCGVKGKDQIRQGGIRHCHSCWSKKYTHCTSCCTVVELEKAVQIDGSSICSHCNNVRNYECEICESKRTTRRIAGVRVCTSCQEIVTDCCDSCGASLFIYELYDVDDKVMCCWCKEANERAEERSKEAGSQGVMGRFEYMPLTAPRW